MGISPGLIAGIAGLGGSLAGLFGGGGPGNVQLPQMPQAPGFEQAYGNAFSGISNLSPWMNLAQGTIPYAQNTFQGLYNNPYAGGAQQGAGVGAGLGEGAALGAYGAGGALTNAGLSTLPWAQSILQTGFDPQSALYNRTLQQVTDQERAGEAARGIATTPYGAGLENDAIRNFNIDWQNNQLQRQIQAAGGAGSLYGTGASLVESGSGLQANAPGNYAAASAMPYSTFAGIGGGQNQALNSLLGIGSGGQNIANVPIGDWLNYVGAGNQSAGVSNQIAGTGIEQQMQQQRYNQLYGNALGSSLYGIGQQWPSSFPSLFGNRGTNQPQFYGSSQGSSWG